MIQWKHVFVRTIFIFSCFFVSGCLALNAHLPFPWHHDHFTAGPMVQMGEMDGKTSVTIAWRTEKPAGSEIVYGNLSAQKFEKKIASETKTRRHTIILNDLSPSTCYAYRASSDEQEIGKGSFCTFKKFDECFSFAVFGDSGYGRWEQYEIANRIIQYNPDFILHTGDLIYPYGEEWGYETFFYSPYQNLLPYLFFFPSMGNHDALTNSGEPMLNNFRLPNDRSFYSFIYANTYFIALDSTRIAEPAQTIWLIEELIRANNDPDIVWRIVFFHHPPYSNKSGFNGTKRLREKWLHIFRVCNVDIVFSGHNHLYTRFHSHDNITYIIEGVGGREHYRGLASLPKHLPAVAFTHGDAFGFGIVTIQKNYLHFSHITRRGEIDSFELYK